MLAMTSIAVTASICASASEAALLVASFTFVSLNSGMIQRCAKSANDDQEIYSEHPTTSIRFNESPLSEYRLCQGRTAMRRHFDSGVVLSRQSPDAVRPMRPASDGTSSSFCRAARWICVPGIA
jgi:hypothetical protein